MDPSAHGGATSRAAHLLHEMLLPLNRSVGLVPKPPPLTAVVPPPLLTSTPGDSCGSCGCDAGETTTFFQFQLQGPRKPRKQEARAPHVVAPGL